LPDDDVSYEAAAAELERALDRLESSLRGLGTRLRTHARIEADTQKLLAERARFAGELAKLRDDVAVARELLPRGEVPPAVEEFALGCIQALKIPSHRAEIALLEAARARVAADNRLEVTAEDVSKIAPLALRQRRSLHLESYAATIDVEDATIAEALAQFGAAASNGRAPRKRGRREPLKHLATV